METENNKEQSKKGIHYPGAYQVSHNGKVCRVIPLNWEAADHPEGKISIIGWFNY